MKRITPTTALRAAAARKMCRGKLTENDWKRADVRTRYRGHFHPEVQKRIDAL